MREERDDRGDNHRWYARHKEEGNDRDQGPNGRGQGSRDSGDHRFTQPFLGGVETLPRECFDELLLVPCEVIDEAFRVFLRQASDLIAEGKHLASFSFVVLDGFPLPCKLRLEYLSLAFCGKIRA